MKVVIIGASYAGVAAALEARKRYRNAEITLLEKQATVGYIPNGLHLYWDNQIATLNEAFFITQPQLESQNIQCRTEAAVEKIATARKTVDYLKDDQKRTLTYDKLIIATGSSQLSQKISGSDSERVLTYKRLPEAEAALEKINTSQSVTIIGGGQVGVEAADLLTRQHKQVTLIESMDYVLFKYFDKDMIQPLQQQMWQNGVQLQLNQTVSSIKEADQHVTIRFGNQTVSSDAAILSVNVRPDLRFLDEHIQLHMDHTIAVDRYMRTTAEDVFAVGDCIQLPLGETEETGYIPLVNNAVRTGMVAAANLMAPTQPFKGSLRTIGTKIFGYFIASTGMTEAESLFSNRKIETQKQTVGLASLPNAETATIKYVYDAETRVLLGAQIISKTNILEKINTLALAIQTKQTLEDVSLKDYFFHPTFTQLIEATNLTDWRDPDEN